MDGRETGRQLYPHILVIDKQSGGRMLNQGASVLT
jgi:hypothetical protein